METTPGLALDQHLADLGRGLRSVIAAQNELLDRLTRVEGRIAVLSSFGLPSSAPQPEVNA